KGDRHRTTQSDLVRSDRRSFKDNWQSHEIDALYIGVSLELYWNLTPNEFIKYCEAHSRREKFRIETSDALNYLLGQYIGLAIRAPKKYPDRPFLTKTQEKKMMPITDDILLKTATMLGAKINGNDRR
ncbi:hypothetical protein IKG49_03370, partial [Candidatus Saccharibacteria bacterium]|nr:hypothetical protein [Candidatus Saccharibacteria bacterium]